MSAQKNATGKKGSLPGAQGLTGSGPSHCGSLFTEIPDHIAAEIFETLVERPALTIQRILSQGQTTDWQQEDTDEWVVLFAGGARLLFEEGNREETMKPGDYVLIPAGCRHRVTWTDPQHKTIWLALHYQKGKA